MRHQAKATSAGSTLALATFSSLLRAKGGGGPSLRLGLAPLFALAAFLALALAPAFASAAAPERPFLETFGSAAQPSFGGGGFGGPIGMAVDQASGDLLVLDPHEPSTISRWHQDGTAANFSALGTNVIDGKKGGGSQECALEPSSCDKTPQNGLSFAAIAETQVAVDNSGTATDGDIYVDAGGSLIDIFSEEGKYLGQLTASSGGPFGGVCGVAVDSTGAVYVGDYTTGVHKYVSQGAPHNPLQNADSSANFSISEEPCTLAAGAGPTAGFIFVTRFGGTIAKFDSTTGAEKYVVSPAPNTTVSVDPASGHVFAASEEEVREYDASGASAPTEPLSTLSLPETVHGVAVNEATHNAYVDSEASPNVKVYGPLEFELTIDTSGGTGTGAVNCEVNGTTTDEPCAAEYPEGTELELIPAPDSSSAFVHWTGDCTGSGSCILTMGAGHSVGAVFDLIPGPTVSSVTPNKGPLTAGTQVTITGTHLSSATEVKFGAGTATTTENTETQIKATLPGCSAGTFDIRVLTAGGESPNTAADDYTCVASPTITSINPTKGPLTAGTVIEITGTNLAEATKVKFGGGEVSPAFIENTATKLKFTAPACSTGPRDIRVVTAGGESPNTAADNYTCVAAPTITSINPTKGPTAGGNSVTITGANLTGATEVKFGANAATITENTATQIKVNAPAGSAGTVDVIATTPGGASANTAADNYTYEVPTRTLTIAKAGSGTGSVTCNGTNCASTYPDGTKVTLAASAASGSSFAGFSGGGCSGTGCVVTLGADTTVTATFTANPLQETCATNPALCPPPSNLIHLGAAKPQGSIILLKVAVPGPGSLSASGKKLKQAKATANGAGKLTLKLKLTSAGKKLLKKKGKLRVKVKVVFTPAGGSPGRATKTVSFKSQK